MSPWQRLECLVAGVGGIVLVVCGIVGLVRREYQRPRGGRK
jgi:hypothetical protein